MKNHLIVSFLAALVLVTLAGCASEDRHSSSSDASTTTMTTDSKDMTHPGTPGSH